MTRDMSKKNSNIEGQTDAIYLAEINKLLKEAKEYAEQNPNEPGIEDGLNDGLKEINKQYKLESFKSEEIKALHEKIDQPNNIDDSFAQVEELLAKAIEVNNKQAATTIRGHQARNKLTQAKAGGLELEEVDLQIPTDTQTATNADSNSVDQLRQPVQASAVITPKNYVAELGELELTNNFSWYDIQQLLEIQKKYESLDDKEEIKSLYKKATTLAELATKINLDNSEHKQNFGFIANDKTKEIYKKHLSEQFNKYQEDLQKTARSVGIELKPDTGLTIEDYTKSVFEKLKDIDALKKTNDRYQEFMKFTNNTDLKTLHKQIEVFTTSTINQQKEERLKAWKDITKNPLVKPLFDKQEAISTVIAKTAHILTNKGYDIPNADRFGDQTQNLADNLSKIDITAPNQIAKFLANAIMQASNRNKNLYDKLTSREIVLTSADSAAINNSITEKYKVTTPPPLVSSNNIAPTSDNKWEAGSSHSTNPGNTDSESGSESSTSTPPGFFPKFPLRFKKTKSKIDTENTDDENSYSEAASDVSDITDDERSHSSSAPEFDEKKSETNVSTPKRLAKADGVNNSTQTPPAEENYPTAKNPPREPTHNPNMGAPTGFPSVFSGHSSPRSPYAADDSDGKTKQKRSIWTSMAMGAFTGALFGGPIGMIAGAAFGAVAHKNGEKNPKRMVGLAMIGGAIIGFALGGPPGMIAGMALGAALGAIMNHRYKDGRNAPDDRTIAALNKKLNEQHEEIQGLKRERAGKIPGVPTQLREAPVSRADVRPGTTPSNTDTKKGKGFP